MLCFYEILSFDLVYFLVSMDVLIIVLLVIWSYGNILKMHLHNISYQNEFIS